MVADVLILPRFLWQLRLKVRNILEFFLLAQPLELWNFETEREIGHGCRHIPPYESLT